MLKASLWNIDENSILDMYISFILSRTSETYRIRSMKLYLIMIKLLQDANCQGILNQHDFSVTPNDGVSLLCDAQDAILPQTSLQILDVLSDLGTCQQENSETVETFDACIEHIFVRLKSLECTLIEDLKLAVCQQVFL